MEESERGRKQARERGDLGKKALALSSPSPFYIRSLCRLSTTNRWSGTARLDITENSPLGRAVFQIPMNGFHCMYRICLSIYIVSNEIKLGQTKNVFACQ